MNRREILKGIGAIALYGSFPTVLGEFVSSCQTKEKQLRAGFFSESEFELIEQITDTLLPSTSTPGALEAEVPYFVDLVAKNCLNEKDQELIKNGLQNLNDQPPRFSPLSSKHKLERIKQIDGAAFQGDANYSWYRIIKKLALIGYFTSQQGMTKALNYVKIPGEYKECVPYKQGEKGLAKTFLMYY